MMSPDGATGFDEWLDREIRQMASSETGPHPMPAQARYYSAQVPGGQLQSVLVKVAALASVKAATGFTVVVVAASAAGAVGEAAITGSANPGDWGRQVVQQVEKCKGVLAPGSHGIGECVSTFASQSKSQTGTDQGTGGKHAGVGQGSPPSSGAPDNGKPTSRPGGGPPSTPPGHVPPEQPTWPRATERQSWSRTSEQRSGTRPAEHPTRPVLALFSGPAPRCRGTCLVRPGGRDPAEHHDRFREGAVQIVAHPLCAVSA